MTLAAETTETGASGEAGLTRKRIKVDGNARRAHDMVGLLKVVLFTPEDLELVTGGPSGRRRYLDVTLSQLDPVYLRSLSALQPRVASAERAAQADPGGRQPA